MCPSVLVRRLCRKTFCKSTEVPDKLGLHEACFALLFKHEQALHVVGSLFLCLDLVGPCP